MNTTPIILAALHGARLRLEAEATKPKETWMKDDYVAGRTGAFGAAVAVVENLIEAIEALEPTS